jgi:hypothetical protein
MFDSRPSTVYLRINDLYREAEEYRMSELAQAGRQTALDRMIARLGDLLLAYGAILKERADRRMKHVITRELSVAQRRNSSMVI